MLSTEPTNIFRLGAKETSQCAPAIRHNNNDLFIVKGRGGKDGNIGSKTFRDQSLCTADCFWPRLGLQSQRP